MDEKQLSDFSVKRDECPHCGAVWINGKHYWRTGSLGNEADLAGLVCNTPHGCPEKCINPQIGNETGDTWEKRIAFSKTLMKPETES